MLECNKKQMIRLDEDVEGDNDEDDNDDDNDDDKKYEEGITLPHLTESRRRRFWYKKRRTKRSNDEDKLILTLPIFLFCLVRIHAFQVFLFYF